MSTRISYKIKTQIRSVLDTLVTAGSLGCVLEIDASKNPLTMDIPSYPAAFLGMPASASAYETNRANQRTYTFNILIMQQVVKLEDARSIETLGDEILDAFDNVPTLNGAADVAVEPSYSEAEPVSTADKTWVAFVVTIKARALKDLTFTNP